MSERACAHVCGEQEGSASAAGFARLHAFTLHCDAAFLTLDSRQHWTLHQTDTSYFSHPLTLIPSLIHPHTHTQGRVTYRIDPTMRV